MSQHVTRAEMHEALYELEERFTVALRHENDRWRDQHRRDRQEIGRLDRLIEELSEQVSDLSQPIADIVTIAGQLQSVSNTIISEITAYEQAAQNAIAAAAASGSTDQGNAQLTDASSRLQGVLGALQDAATGLGTATNSLIPSGGAVTAGPGADPGAAQPGAGDGTVGVQSPTQDPTSPGLGATGNEGPGGGSIGGQPSPFAPTDGNGTPQPIDSTGDAPTDTSGSSSSGSSGSSGSSDGSSSSGAGSSGSSDGLTSSSGGSSSSGPSDGASATTSS